MHELLHGVNLLHAFVAALAAFLLGALWYSPVLFAKPWMAAHGFSMEDVAAMQKQAPKAYSVSFVCMFIMALAFSWLLHLLHWSGWMGGVHLALFCWTGFALTLGLIAHVYANKKIGVFLIDGGYQLVYMAIMGAILGAWQ
jgi:hypothetical protein